MADDLKKFHDSLAELIKSFEQKGLGLKILSDLDLGVVRVYAEGTSALDRARIGIDEVAELAYDTAEHHPYWNLLYDGSQIIKIVLDKWNDNLTEEDLKEIRWYANKIRDSLGNVSDIHHHE